MFGYAINKLNSLVTLNHNEILKELLSDKALQDRIIYLNTEDQLFQRGEDKLGRTLESIGGGYSPFTIQIKQEKGQPYDRVTLEDTGEFYESFHVVNEDTYIMIIANPMKGDKDINQEWGGHTIGLQVQNVQKIIDEIKDKFIQEVKGRYISA